VPFLIDLNPFEKRMARVVLSSILLPAETKKAGANSNAG
jgi:hypothetical protein